MAFPDKGAGASGQRDDHPWTDVVAPAGPPCLALLGVGAKARHVWFFLTGACFSFLASSCRQQGSVRRVLS